MFLSLVACALIASLIPFETVTVPAWKIRYVDGAGRPVSGLKLRQTWQNESVESSPHFAVAFTADDGAVAFPERRLRAPLILRLIGPVRNVLATGVHASFGPSSWIVPVCGFTERGGGAVYEGADLPQRVVIERSAPSGSLGLADDPDCAASRPVSAPAGR